MIAVLVLVGLTFLPRSWAVSNAVVGTCRTGTHYSTIQAAIDAADVGSTVQVCPGTYSEILTITNNLSLKGVASGTSDSVIITAPPAGVPANGSSAIWGSLTAQVLVQNATANLSNLTIDGGGGSSCPKGVTSVGVLLQAAGGSVTNSTFQNPPLCLQISALLDHTTNFNFSDNYLRDCEQSCLEVDFGTGTTVKGNDIASVGFTVDGIETQQLAGPATISANVIRGNIDWGIVAQSSPSVTITSNNVMSDLREGGAIVLFATTQAIAEGNHVSAQTMAQPTGKSPNRVGIFLDDNGAVGGNTILNNTVTGGACGLQIHTTNRGDTIAPNTYFNEPQIMCTF